MTIFLVVLFIATNVASFLTGKNLGMKKRAALKQASDTFQAGVGRAEQIGKDIQNEAKKIL